MFGQHNKILEYVQNLSNISSLFEKLSSSMASESNDCFLRIWMLRRNYYLINIFSMKIEVYMCNITIEQKLCRLQGGIKRYDCII